MNQRIRKIRRIIREKKLDAILVTDMNNVRYLSDFTGSNAQLLFTLKDNFFFTDGRYILQSKKQVKEFKIQIYKQTPFKDIAELIFRKNIKKLGFEGNSLFYDHYKFLKDNLKKSQMLSVSKELASLREIKEKKEINLIKKAIQISEKALLELKPKIKPGISEKYISWELEKLMKEKGAESLAFDIISLSGKNSALVHGEPSNKKLKKGELLMIDFGCVYQGYHSDQTVTYGIGSLSRKAKDIYNIVKTAQEKAMSVIKPGVKIKKPVEIVTEYFESQGYELIHGLGHGVGLQIHENPSLSSLSEDVFKEGMVFSLEPGIYIENLGGVRIEDLVVVTKRGCRKLTTLSKDLEIL